MYKWFFNQKGRETKNLKERVGISMDQRAIFYVTRKDGEPKPIFKIERDPKTVMRATGEPGVR